MRVSWRDGRLWAAGVAVVLGVVLSLSTLSVHRGDASADAGREVAELVPDRVAEMLSYTPSTVQTDLGDEGSWLTEEFASSHGARVRDTIGPSAIAASVSTSATIKGTAVVAADPQRVVLLVFVDVATSTPAADEAVVRGARLDVVVEKVSGTWLIDSIDPV